MSENTYEWKNSLKETPQPGKIVVAWTEYMGLSQAIRSKEGKWTLSNNDGQTWYMDDKGVWWCKITPPIHEIENGEKK